MNQNTQLSLFEEHIPDPSVEDEVSLLALSEIQGVGFATARSLFNVYNGQLTKVWDARSDELYEVLKQAKTPQPQIIAKNIIDKAKTVQHVARERHRFYQRSGVSIVLRNSRAYPKRLLDLSDPPAWLFVEGDVQLLSDPAIVTVVGTRNPSSEGIAAAKHLSVLLVTGKSTILSGLAEGIDALAHKTAVDYGAPTIAVLGHGIDVTFPTSTADLRREMTIRGGAVVSEYLPRDSYAKERFVMRNRIQAALGCVVAIVEGMSKSGTAHTVRFARSLKRPLFGVRLGPPLHTPQQELLEDLAKQNDPVFDLKSEQDRERWRDFLRMHIPVESRQHRTRPHLFLGKLEEIIDLTSEYDGTIGDLDWLISQLTHYRHTLRSTDGDANQSGDS